MLSGLSRSSVRRLTYGLLTGIVGLALLLRLWGLGFGLPYVYHPDEPRYVIGAQRLFKTRDLDPAHLPNISSSSFVYVINAAAYVPYYAVGRLAGEFASPDDVPEPAMLAMGVGTIARPTVFLLGRLVTTLFSAANVIVVFLIGRKLFGRASIGLLAAVMLAVSPTAVAHSRYVTPDTYVTFFVSLAFLGAAHVYRDDRPAGYILTGAALGCAASSKIGGVLVVLPWLTACIYRHGLKGLIHRHVFAAIVAAGLTFVVTTPYIFGNAQTVINDILFEGRHYASGHAGMEGDSLAWYLNLMWLTSGVIYGLGAAEIGRGIFSRSRETLLLAVFPVAYFVFIASFPVRNDRTFLPMAPFLFLLAAAFLAHGYDWARASRRAIVRQGAAPILAGLFIASLIQPASVTVAEAARLTTLDSRETARVWIDTHLPAGARIAVESYAPYVDPTRYTVQGFGRLIDHDPAWYVAQDFDYLIFSQGMFGRFYREPAKYPIEFSRYEELFARFEAVATFTDGGYEVRIVQTPAAP